MKVADVMSKHVEYVTSRASVQDVCSLIFGRGINGVPVVDGKKVIGFITERDILSKFYPSMQDYVEDPISSRDFEKMEDKTAEVFSMPAEKIMSTTITTVTSQTPLLRAQSLMFVNKVGRLPVVDGKGNLIGILSKGDIFGALVGNRVIVTEDEDYNDWLSRTYYASLDVEDRIKHEIPDLMKVFIKNKVKNVIDIGIGTGDHVIELARKGLFAYGTDRSSVIIKDAIKRKNKLPKSIMKRAVFFNGESEPVLDKLKIIFDAAILMGNTISHNPYNLEKLIKNTSKYLSKRGVMIFQITNFEKVVKTKKRFLRFNFAKIKNGIEKEHAFLEFYDLPNLKDKTILKTFAILRSDGKRWRWVSARNTLMAYSNKNIIKNILRKNGFSNVKFYGGSFNGRKWDYLFRKPFKPLESDWLNVVATR